MKDFIPDYNKCSDKRKEVFHLICKHCIKNDIMLCNLGNKRPCIAWEGYKHED
jgi:hypothetical protein